MSLAQTTVFDYAQHLASAEGMTFSTVATVKVGIIEIDPIGLRVTVHPYSERVTLEMNARGPILPGAYDKT